MVKHQKQTIMTRQVGGIHKGFAFEGFLKCLKWSEFAGSTSRKWSRKHSLGVYYNTIWLTTCGLHQFSKKYVCHSYDWLWTPPNTLNLKAFRAVSCIFWWLPSQLSKVKLEAKVLQDPSRPILQALSKQAFGDALPPSTVSKAPENWCTKIQPCVLFCLKRSGTIQSHMKGTNGAAYVHSKQYMNSVCMCLCKYVCTYLCMNACMNACMYACMHVYTLYTWKPCQSAWDVTKLYRLQTHANTKHLPWHCSIQNLFYRHFMQFRTTKHATRMVDWAISEFLASFFLVQLSSSTPVVLKPGALWRVGTQPRSLNEGMLLWNAMNKDGEKSI